MNTRLKYIGVLVIVALLGVAAYQAYWLEQLHFTIGEQMDNDIREAMRVADLKELFLRLKSIEDNGPHGMIDVTAGVGRDGSINAKAVTTTQVTLDGDTLEQKTGVVLRSSPQADSVTTADDDAFMKMLEEQISVTELASMIQQGLHLGVDRFEGTRYEKYDTLLTAGLQQLGMSGEHRLLCIKTDTVFSYTTPGYVPSKTARHYEYNWDNYGRYELTIEPTTGLVLREMAGILIASGVIILLLGIAFYALVKTILKQRTLDEMKTDFTNNITHELKTPIAVAYAANDALLNFGERADEAKRRHYLTLCRQQLERLSGMVEQILSLSMERRRQFHLNVEAVVLDELLQPVIEQQRLKADKPVVITTSIQPAGLTIQADRSHLSNMLNNLIDNAIKYSPGEARIEITATPSAISVTDHGMGIAADNLPHIYDKFYRVPTGDLHDVKGYGLGLFYVKTMVEKHGWSILATSVKGEGTTFTIQWA
ncbi:MAG: HAMP domain-containing histidine kinase [Muribaculaceae bacterium]|nr:HAMP domain-containing histidine kinase [Muribaculaceae bacterium]